MTKILVIEDEDAIRANIIEMLELEGFEPIAAQNGAIGVELVTAHKPALIICDIAMPEMDGYEVLLKVRSDPASAHTPFIFLTARADRSFMRHGMELGADDYVTKPFTFAELRAAIYARLARHVAAPADHEQGLGQAKKTLIQLVSHELRTPLISINMVTDIALRRLEQIPTQQLRELLETLERGAQRLNRVVEQTVFIVQLETNALSWESIAQQRSSITLSDLLIASVDLARRFAYRSPDVSIQLDERDNNTRVLADTRALRHALAELLSNALNFSPEHSNVIVSQWQAEGMIWISILDQGPGIPPEELDKAFEAFQQINREKQEQQGIGLGLPLSRRIIEAHSGTLTLNSVVGKGTQVTIGLPIFEG